MLRVKSSRPTPNFAQGISGADLVRIVNKVGNSLAAISKVVELERVSTLEKSILKNESAALACGCRSKEKSDERSHLPGRVNRRNRRRSLVLWLTIMAGKPRVSLSA
jgi:hypothetical protein